MLHREIYENNNQSEKSYQLAEADGRGLQGGQLGGAGERKGGSDIIIFQLKAYV